MAQLSKAWARWSPARKIATIAVILWLIKHLRYAVGSAPLCEPMPLADLPAAPCVCAVAT